jgi:hypothetical protein
LGDNVIDFSASGSIGGDICPGDIRDPATLIVLDGDAKVQEFVRLKAGRAEHRGFSRMVVVFIADNDWTLGLRRKAKAEGSKGCHASYNE